MQKPIRKAVLPVAGLGTRFLPATKSVPKELLTIVDRPLIQYIIDEAREAGIEQFILVTGRGKVGLIDYFDNAFELEQTMLSRGKSLDPLQPTRLTPGSLVSVRQQRPLGLGHAVWCARALIGDEPFAVLLPDELMIGQPGCLAQMVAAYRRVGGNMVAALEVPRSEVGKYGIINPGKTSGALTEVTGLVEKPSSDAAPSSLMIPGRYILQPEIMRMLEIQDAGAGGEIQLTDAMAKLVGTQPFHAYLFDGVRHDCGDKLGFAKANAALALATRDIGPEFKAYVQDLLKTQD